MISAVYKPNTKTGAILIRNREILLSTHPKHPVDWYLGYFVFISHFETHLNFALQN